MATYPVKIPKLVIKRINDVNKEYDTWRKDNPDWDKDWSKGVAGVGEVGEWKKNLVKKTRLE